MSLKLSVHIMGGEQMWEAFKSADYAVRHEMGKAIEKLSIEAKNKAQELSPIDTGRLRASITHRAPIFKGNDVQGIIGTNTKYAPYMEFGRKAGKMPPISALKPWARRKLGDERLAFVVARAIAKKGVKPREYFKGSIDYVRPLVDRHFKVAMNGIVRHLARS